MRIYKADSDFTPDHRWLAIDSGIDGYATIYASQAGTPAGEDKVKRQGYFSYAFIEGLSGGGANERGEVMLEGIIRYLDEKVRNASEE